MYFSHTETEIGNEVKSPPQVDMEAALSTNIY